MIDNRDLAAFMDAAIGDDYTAHFQAGLVAYFFNDGTTVGQVILAGRVMDEAVSVACYGVALGADQSLWVTGALRSDTHPDPHEDPFSQPCIVYLAARKDQQVNLWRRDLSIDDNGRASAKGPLRSRSAVSSILAKRVTVPWALEHPDGDAESLAAFLRSRKHKVSP